MSDTIHIQLITTSANERVIRLDHPPTGLSIERKLDPLKSLVAQKQRMVRLFERILTDELALA